MLPTLLWTETAATKDKNHYPHYRFAADQIGTHPGFEAQNQMSATKSRIINFARWLIHAGPVSVIRVPLASSVIWLVTQLQERASARVSWKSAFRLQFRAAASL